MSKDVIKVGKGRYLIQIKNDFRKQSRRAKKYLRRQMKLWNELLAEKLIEYGEQK